MSIYHVPGSVLDMLDKESDSYKNTVKSVPVLILQIINMNSFYYLFPLEEAGSLSVPMIPTANEAVHHLRE